MPKKEYIERVALIKFAMDHIPNIHGDTTMKSVKRALKAAPTADDVVEVVRCKDCIYNNGACTHSEIYDDTNYNPDYYCADGERKEET